MALTEITCPSCSHRGFIPTQSLGRVLRCAACGRARFVRRGKQLVCSRDDGDDADVEDAAINDVPVEIDEAARWAAYEGTAPPAKPPPKRRPPRPLLRKRKLVPRVPTLSMGK